MCLIAQFAIAQSVEDTGSVSVIGKVYRNKSAWKYYGFDSLDKGNGVKLIAIPKASKLHDIFYIAIPGMELPEEPIAKSNNPLPLNKAPLLKVTGNILYDVNYRSRIDTPYAENNVYQHTLQTRLDMLYKDRYPFKVYLTVRFSNSSLFRNYTDLNFQFNPGDFKRRIQQKLLNIAEQYVMDYTRQLDSLKRLIETKKRQISFLDQSLQGPGPAQLLVEQRERELFKNNGKYHLPDASVIKSRLENEIRLNEKPAVKSDTSGMEKSEKGNLLDNRDDRIVKLEERKDSVLEKRHLLDSLLAELKEAEGLYRKLKSAKELNLAELKNSIINTKDAQTLEKKLKELNIADSALPKGYKTLYSLQSLGIGRSIADYSELSVKNISITGLQLEYNPHYYYAVAVGRVDYRFRDYIVPARSRSNQYVALARFGKGTKNGNHIIFTYYTGRRQFYNSSVSQANGGIPGYNLAGMTIEGSYRINRNISIVAEVAKSTMPYYSLDSLQRKEWMNSVTKFNERSNEAYSGKLISFFPKTLTKVNANLRYTGANFQSFSTFTTGASQLRWAARLEQPFFKKQLTIISSLQQNDYENPFVTTSYKSSSLLASFRANLRIKKWPVISFGYYPSYQLIKTGFDDYSESRYYTMTGSAGYYYKIKKVQLSSYLIYSRFYNEANDSGFVYYNSRNLLLSQSIFFDKMSGSMNVSVSTGTDYNMYTNEDNIQFNIGKFITAGGGVKMIKYSLLSSLQWGYSGSLMLRIPKLGDIQLMADKGFIPGLNRQLMENNTGRLTYYKTF